MDVKTNKSGEVHEYKTQGQRAVTDPSSHGTKYSDKTSEKIDTTPK